jgi:hypothetical protein
VDAIRGLKDATHVEDVEALLRAEYVAALTEYLSAKLVQETASRQISPGACASAERQRRPDLNRP